MSQLTQARRMVAKSRRRIWRLARRAGYLNVQCPEWEVPHRYAEFILWNVQHLKPGYMREAARLRDEYRKRIIAADEIAWKRARRLPR